MRYLPLLFIFWMLFSCSEQIVVEKNVKNLDGSYSKVKSTRLDGWAIMTSDNGSYISLSRDGDQVVYVSETGFGGLDLKGRTISIESASRTHRVDVEDSDLDRNYDFLTIISDKGMKTDKSIDGSYDFSQVWGEKNSQVRYNGELHRLIEDVDERYISINGQKIEFQRAGPVWEPIEKVHNEERN